MRRYIDTTTGEYVTRPRVSRYKGSKRATPIFDLFIALIAYTAVVTWMLVTELTK